MSEEEEKDDPAGTPHAPGAAHDHRVRQGECIEKIAFAKGHFWRYLWDHANNEALKDLRKEPNVLLPGDRVHVPALRIEEVDLATNQVHRFRRKGVPSKLSVIVCIGGEPRANEPYELTIDGRLVFSGKTGSDGRVEHSVSPRARRAKLVVGEGAQMQEFSLLLAHLDPIDEVSGAQARLANLGFDSGPPDGELGPRTIAAIRDFQTSRDLRASGELDDATRDALRSDYEG